MSLIIKNRIQEFDVKEYYKKIYKGSKAEFMKKLEGEIEAGKKQCVVTANPEIFMLADRMKEVRGLLMAEDTTIVADRDWNPHRREKAGISYKGKDSGC